MKAGSRIIGFGMLAAGFLWTGTAVRAADYYVSQGAENASDENPGTLEQPFETLSGAFRVLREDLKPGDRVWVLDGTYRESVSLWSASDPHNIPAGGIRLSADGIALAGLPGHRPVISGSAEVTAWDRHQDAVWVTDFVWERFHPFPVTFVDGRPLRQIGGTVERNPERWHGRQGEGLDDLEPGTFFYDESESKLYVWLENDASPEAHTMEVYARRHGLIVGRNLRHMTVRNLDVVHVGIKVFGPYTVLEDVDQSWGPFVGCFVRGDGSRILNSSFDWNGNSGMGGGGTGIQIIDCRTNHNNWRQWAAGWHAGGVKFIGAIHSWLFQRHEAAYNNGFGIWFDYARGGNVTIEGCRSFRNTAAGIHFEVVGHGILANNVVYENAGRGIYLSNANNTLVLHNLAYRNGLSGIVSIGIPREGHPADRNVVWGNILVDNCWNASRDLDRFPEGWGHRPELIMPSDEERNAACVSDFNVIYRSEGRLLRFGRNWDVGHAGSLEQWTERTGWDPNSVVTRPLFVDEENYDFRPATNSPILWMVTAGPLWPLDADGRPRDRHLRTPGPFEADAEILKAIRADLPLGKHVPLRLTVRQHGSPDPWNAALAGTFRSIIYGPDFQGPLGFGVQGWTVQEIPFLQDRFKIVLDSQCSGATMQIGRQVRRLHFLVGALHPTPGRPAAACVISREDGETRRIVWTPDEHGALIAAPADGIRTLLGHSGRTLARADSDHPQEAALFITTWENDNEWLPVSQLEFETLDPEAVFCVFGVTGERIGVGE